jgi:hypothetical protein
VFFKINGDRLFTARLEGTATCEKLLQNSSIFDGFTTTTLQQMIFVKLLNTQARSVLDILKILWAAFP